MEEATQLPYNTASDAIQSAPFHILDEISFLGAYLGMRRHDKEPYWRNDPKAELGFAWENQVGVNRTVSH